MRHGGVRAPRCRDLERETRHGDRPVERTVASSRSFPVRRADDGGSRPLRDDGVFLDGDMVVLDVPGIEEGEVGNENGRGEDGGRAERPGLHLTEPKLSRISAPTRSSRGLLPSAGPTIPSCSIVSTIRAERA